MNIEFHPEAAEEFEAAVDWYDARETGLGLDFAVEINAAIHRAAAMPDAWTRLSGNVRRVLVNRFPYGVLYEPGETDLLVLAVMHLRREPGYWMARRGE
jgi:plasmid stabilization system protein ParE